MIIIFQRNCTFAALRDCRQSYVNQVHAQASAILPQGVVSSIKCRCKKQIKAKYCARQIIHPKLLFFEHQSLINCCMQVNFQNGTDFTFFMSMQLFFFILFSSILGMNSAQTFNLIYLKVGNDAIPCMCGSFSTIQFPQVHLLEKRSFQSTCV